jgi:hypothetical protein
MVVDFFWSKERTNPLELRNKIIHYKYNMIIVIRASVYMSKYRIILNIPGTTFWRRGRRIWRFCFKYCDFHANYNPKLSKMS